MTSRDLPLTADGSAQLLHEETLRELRLMSKLHQVSDDDLRARHSQDAEWARKKQAYVDRVVKEVREARAADRNRIGMHGGRR